MNGIPINIIRYGDDPINIAENINNLPRLLTKIVQSGEDLRPNTQHKKTKIKIIIKKNIGNISLQINDEQIREN